MGGFVALLIHPTLVFLLWGLGGFALAYTFWSIYYQAFVAKEWCTLCLMVQFLFAVEFFLNINLFSEFSLNFARLTFSDLVAPLLGTLGSIIFWIFLKPFVQKSQKIVPLENDLKRFKNNPNLFLSILHKQDRMPFVPHSMETIVIGNPNAEHTITIITNPFCQPCARTHKIIEDLLDTNENLNCQVIFVTSNSEGDRQGIVVRTILSLPRGKQALALQKWYKNEERNIGRWQIELGFIDNKKTESIVAQHQIWCETAKIIGTPTLYLNGYQMPEMYLLTDLKGILKYLPTTDLQIEYK